MFILPCCRPALFRFPFSLWHPGRILEVTSLNSTLSGCCPGAQHSSPLPALQMSSASGTHSASSSCCLQMFCKCSPVMRTWKNPAATSWDDGWLQFANCHPRWIMDLAKHELEESRVFTHSRLEAIQPSQKGWHRHPTSSAARQSQGSITWAP